jgi:hypothetical protein
LTPAIREDEQAARDEQPEGRPDLPHQVLMERQDRGVEAGVEEELGHLGDALALGRVQGRHLGARLLDGGARPEAPDTEW